MGSIRSPAALPRMAVRGRAFLSEHADDNRSRYNKDGLNEVKPIASMASLCLKDDGFRCAQPILRAFQHSLGAFANPTFADASNTEFMRIHFALIF
jgi:hypothetical protein